MVRTPLVLETAVLVAALLACNGGSKTDTSAQVTPAGEAAPVPAAPTPPPAPTVKPAALGETVTLSDSTWSVISAKDVGPEMKSNNQFVEGLKSEGAKYIVVVFKVTNLGSKEERIFEHPKVRDSLGREFDAHDKAVFFLPKGKKSMQLEAVPAGLPKEFWAIYEVPAASSGFSFMARELSVTARTYPIALGL
jgi:hypothetical protein